MARIVCTTILIVLLSVLVGCQNFDSGRSQRETNGGRRSPGAPVVVVDAEEADMVEQMAVDRQAYLRGLELLVGYYDKTGSNTKLRWAKKELAALNRMPRYRYIVDPGSPNQKPSTLISEADDLYYDGQALEKKAGVLPILKNENQLIQKHPSSDKIDDAAYRIGEICEYLKDYSIALSFYKRTYEWDPDTNYPARFKSARILDKYLHQNAEALVLYQQAVKLERRFEKYREWKVFAERRIRELQKLDENEG
jgi:tetratricopeptide (TPR) repeat protein